MSDFRHFLLYVANPNRWICKSDCRCGVVDPPTTGSRPDTSGTVLREKRRAA